jgi:hypothetical protein
VKISYLEFSTRHEGPKEDSLIQKKYPENIFVFGAKYRIPKRLAEIPSFIRTLPSTLEFHQVMHYKCSWVITTDRELEIYLPHPAPKESIH